MKGMGHVLYERPREKLRNRGVAYLTTIELIQLVIGSGGARVSAARLAKEVGKQIDKRTVTFDSLLSINGLGEAKVCQLLAAFELGERLEQTSLPPKFTRSKLNAYTKSILLPRETFLCIWFDGSHHEIDRKRYSLDKRRQQSDSVRTLFADALAVSARSILVYVHKGGSELTPDLYEAGLAGLIKESSIMLHIALVDLIAINKTTSQSWRAEV